MRSDDEGESARALRDDRPVGVGSSADDASGWAIRGACASAGAPMASWPPRRPTVTFDAVASSSVRAAGGGSAAGTAATPREDSDAPPLASAPTVVARSAAALCRRRRKTASTAPATMMARAAAQPMTMPTMAPVDSAVAEDPEGCVTAHCDEQATPLTATAAVAPEGTVAAQPMPTRVEAVPPSIALRVEDVAVAMATRPALMLVN